VWYNINKKLSNLTEILVQCRTVSLSIAYIAVFTSVFLSLTYYAVFIKNKPNVSHSLHRSLHLCISLTNLRSLYKKKPNVTVWYGGRLLSIWWARRVSVSPPGVWLSSESPGSLECARGVGRWRTSENSPVRVSRHRYVHGDPRENGTYLDVVANKKILSKTLLLLLLTFNVTRTQ